MTYTAPNRPLPIGGVLDDAVRLYRASFSRSWILAFAFSLALAALSAVIFLSMPVYGAASTASLQIMMSALRSPRVLAAYVLVTLLSLAAYGAITALESAVARGDTSLSLAQACAAGFRRLPAMVLATLLFALAFIVGLIVLVIPGIWVWGRLQLWLAAMFAENQSALGSLASSWNLTRGNWWRGSAIFSVAVIMIVVVSIVFSVAGGVVVGILRVDPRDGQMVIQLFSLVANTITYPFFVATWLSTHHDFTLRREGADLAARARALA